MVPFLSLCCYHHIWIHTSQLFIQGMPATRALHIFDPPLKDEGSTNQIHSEKGLFFKYMSTIRELQIHAPVITLQVFLIARVVPNQWRFLKPQPPQVLGCDSTSHFARRKTALSLLPAHKKLKKDCLILLITVLGIFDRDTYIWTLTGIFETFGRHFTLKKMLIRENSLQLCRT